MSRNSQLVKNTFILSVGMLVPKLLALITLPIVTSQISTASYGVYDLIISIGSVLIPVLNLQIQQAAFRFLITNKEDSQRDAYVTSAVIYMLSVIVGMTALVLLSLFFVEVSLPVLILTCLIYGCESVYIVLGQILRGLDRAVKYSASTVIYSVAHLVFILLFVLYLKMELMGILSAMAASYLAAVIYMVLQPELRRHFRLSAFSRTRLKELLRFSVPIVPSTISFWIVNLSDRFIITSFLGVSMNGIYSVANKIPHLFTTAYSVFYMSWTESATRAANDEDVAEYYSDMFAKLNTFLIGVMLLLIAVTPFLFYIFIDERYASAYNQIPVLFAGVFFNSIASFYGGIYIALKKTGHVGASSMAGAVINLVVNLMFVKTMGLYAASLSTAVSYIVMCIYRYYDVGRLIKIKYDFKRLTLELGIFALSAVLCYIASLWAVILSIVIALGFNILYNRYMLTFALKKLKLIK